VAEERNVYRDYQAAIGSPPPRIARVWLIALSLLQRREGRCTFGETTLTNGHQEIRVI
jgi:hypothetical protein